MNHENTSQDTIDLKQLFFSLIENWLVILASIIFCVGYAIVYLKITPEEYSVDALVQVEDKKGASAALLGELSNVVDQESPAQAEIEIIRSRLVLGQVVNDLMLDVNISPIDNHFISSLLNKPKPEVLYTNNGISVILNNHIIEIKSFIVPLSYKDQNLKFVFSATSYEVFDASGKFLFKGKLNKRVRLSNDLDAWDIQINGKLPKDTTLNFYSMLTPSAINKIKAQLTVSEVGKLTGIIKLNYLDNNRYNAVNILNVILNRYSSQNKERSNAETIETLKFLNDQLPKLKDDLDTSELAFNKFRKQYGTIDINQESKLYLEQTSNFESQKLQLNQKRAELSSRYTENHPIMRQIESEISSLNKSIAGLGTTLKGLPDLQRRYVQLQRDVEVQTQLYNNLLNTFQQLRVAKAGEIGNVRIIDNAVLPKYAVKPQRNVVLALSLFLGIFIGSLIAILKNIIHTGVKDAVQIEDRLSLPVYATVPRSKHQEHRTWRIKKSRYLPILAHLFPEDPSVESLRNLRTALYFSLKNAKNNIILVSGPSPEIGKSFVAVNLATVFAQSGKKVLLVDADLRRGYLHKYFKINNTNGIANLLINADNHKSVVFKSEVEGLDFISRGPSPKAPSELLGSDEFKHFIQNISLNYDYVIVDSAPLLAVTDALVIAELASTCLLVARHGITTLRELELSLQRFHQSGIKVNGLVLNDIERKVGYGYGNYGYGYNYSYKGND